jgi:hypothetical protein
MIGIKRGSWTVTLPVAGAAVAFLMLLFLPRMKAISDISAQLRSKQDFIMQTERLRPILQSLGVELEETGAYASTWAARSAEGGELSELFGKISQLTKQCGTETTKFEPLPPVDFETLQKVPVAVGLSGSYASLARLVAELEALPATMWVEDFKLDAPREAGENARCELNLAIFINKREKSD